MKTVEKVISILKELSGVENIDTSAHLQNDLALDSLMMVTLLFEIEDSFNIQLDESDMNPLDLETVDSIIRLVRKYGEKSEKEEN